MMKLFMFFLFMLFMFSELSFYVGQMITQNLYFIMFFYFLMNNSFNEMNYWQKIYYSLGYDYYSFGLILLTLWIISLMYMVSLNNLMILNGVKFMMIIILMTLFLLMCFVSMNLMLFYLFFESSLIPIFLLILGWGFQVDRIQAGYYMMLYTLFGSLPLFYMIIYYYTFNFTLMFDLMMSFELNWLMYIMLIMAFLVKMPVYFLHLWLPKAHVEAPLVGSMVLAGVMLKLGSYGLMRLMLTVKKSFLNYNIYLMIISLLGGIYAGLVCLYQIDLKMLVAYSSVVHMSLLMSGLMTLFNFGYYGGYLMMISHGLCSSGLFCLVNINYERLMSRSIYVNKGMINFFPSLTLMWFLLCSSCLSFPPSLNLFSEIFLLSSVLMLSEGFILILMSYLFISAIYMLYFYSFTQHGGFNSIICSMKKIVLIEYLILVFHWVPLNLLFMFMYMYM